MSDDIKKILDGINVNNSWYAIAQEHRDMFEAYALHFEDVVAIEISTRMIIGLLTQTNPPPEEH